MRRNSGKWEVEQFSKREGGGKKGGKGRQEFCKNWRVGIM